MALTYQTYRSYLKKRFGKPVLRIPVNGGFSCPNRDGTKSTAGCSFCDNRSFSPVALTADSVIEQLMSSIRRSSNQHVFFMPYLQPFSNTYGSVEYIRSLYEPLISIPGVVGLAVGTRPDCLSNDTVAYLEDVSTRTYLSIELGLQSASDETLAMNNRGHTYADFEQAVFLLARKNIETVAHVMLGLYGDTRDSMLDTARRVSSLPVSGVKIHQLMVIRGTRAETWYAHGTLKTLPLEEYACLAAEFILLLREDQYIHRLMADSKVEYGLLAPLWSAEKAGSLQVIKKILREKYGVMQREEM